MAVTGGSGGGAKLLTCRAGWMKAAVALYLPDWQAGLRQLGLETAAAAVEHYLPDWLARGEHRKPGT